MGLSREERIEAARPKERDRHNTVYVQDLPLKYRDCTMSEFFESWAQFLFITLTIVVILSFISAVLMFSIPKYRVWTANQSIARQEALGMAELARSAQEAQIVIEQANAEIVAMGVLARGERSAANTRSDTIEIMGAAIKRYPEYSDMPLTLRHNYARE